MRENADSAAATPEQVPIKQSFCRSLRRDIHCKSLMLTLLICGCLSAILWCRLSAAASTLTPSFTTPSSSPINGRAAHTSSASGGATTASNPCEDGYVYIPVAFVVMLYFVYLVECWHCHTRIELQCKIDVRTVYERVRAMREATLVVWWKAVCYHYLRRTRQVTRYRNGDAFTTTQVYYERVNSHSASCAFNFASCGVRDVSKRLIDLERYPATKIRFSKGFSFATSDAESEYETQRVQFFQYHERRDDYMEVREGLDFMNLNFQEYFIAFADPDRLPWYISQATFWIASLLLLTWPLRVLIEYRTAYVHYHVHKLFGTNYLRDVGGVSNCESLNEEEGGASMTRASTVASASEFEFLNVAMVPSYSEALLMEPGRGVGGATDRLPNDDGIENTALSSVSANQPPRYYATSLYGTTTTLTPLPPHLTTSLLMTNRSKGISASTRQYSIVNLSANYSTVVVPRSISGDPYAMALGISRQPKGLKLQRQEARNKRKSKPLHYQLRRHSYSENNSEVTAFFQPKNLDPILMASTIDSPSEGDSLLPMSESYSEIVNRGTIVQEQSRQQRVGNFYGSSIASQAVSSEDAERPPSYEDALAMRIIVTRGQLFRYYSEKNGRIVGVRKGGDNRLRFEEQVTPAPTVMETML